MSTTVRDASWITKKNRDVALYSWKNQQNTIVNAGGVSFLAEQPSYQSGQVISQRNLGCTYCATNVSTGTNSVVINYPFVGSGGGGPTGGAFPGQ
jgi:hypothetical protein